MPFLRPVKEQRPGSFKVSWLGCWVWNFPATYPWFHAVTMADVRLKEASRLSPYPLNHPAFFYTVLTCCTSSHPDSICGVKGNGSKLACPKNAHKQDKTRQDKTRQDKTRQDKTRQDKTRQDKTRQNKTKQNKTNSWLYLQSEDPFWRPMVLSDGPINKRCNEMQATFSTVQWSMFKISYEQNECV